VFEWYTLAAAASFAMILTITYGWWAYDGDISYGRLNQIPFQEIKWYHAVAPAILLLLTRIGIPVSTTFLVLSAFASTVVISSYFSSINFDITIRQTYAVVAANPYPTTLFIRF
jgi:hypothetical protein